MRALAIGVLVVLAYFLVGLYFGLTAR